MAGYCQELLSVQARSHACKFEADTVKAITCGNVEGFIIVIAHNYLISHRLPED